MSTALVGRGSIISWVAESSWGTEVSPRTVSGRITGTTLQSKVVVEDVPHLSGGNTSGTGLVRSESYQSMESFEGTLSQVLAYQGQAQGLLWANLLSNTDAGSGPYTHTLVVPTGGSAPGSLSGALQLGNGNAQEFYGAMVRAVTIKCDANKPVMVDWDIVAKNGAARGAASPSFPSLGTSYNVLAPHASTLGWNSATYNFKSATLKVDKKIDTSLRECGSLYISQPDVADYLDITIEAEIALRDDTLEVAHRALTSSSLTLTFTDPVTSYALAITLHNAQIRSYDEGISGPGYRTAKVVWKARSDGSNSGLGVVITNNVPTLALS